MASTNLVYPSSASNTYASTMPFFHSETLATLFIIISTIFLLLLRRLLPISQSTTSIWIRFLLVLEPAIEFPLIFALHPTVMVYNIGKSTKVPHLD
ncbi:hypothetical protein ABVK25_011441 [Lepraria finkii]|uniref:Uncharacterized protein n=1 Tax=Lepraria finkii TaxID=1340010 RepID=A0ABR4AP39_9LECA